MNNTRQTYVINLACFQKHNCIEHFVNEVIALSWFSLNW